MFKLGEVKVPTDDDYTQVKHICENNDGWSLEYSKSNLKVWIKSNELSSFQMLKVKGEFEDVSAATLYSVVQDGEYRSQWDEKMIDGFEICYLSPFSDIGYYSMKSPKPFKNRDFVTQRCWLDYGQDMDKIVFNHSVNHAVSKLLCSIIQQDSIIRFIFNCRYQFDCAQKCPPKKGYVRGISYLTATYIKPTSARSCSLIYVTQADPGGSLPAWIVNVATKVMAPKMFKKMQRACVKYDKWKAKNNPDYMPWVDPEKIRVPKLDWNDIISLDADVVSSNNDVDESQVKEGEVEKADLDEGSNGNDLN